MRDQLQHEQQVEQHAQHAHHLSVHVLRLRRIIPDNIIHNVIRQDGTQDTQTCATHVQLVPTLYCNRINRVVYTSCAFCKLLSSHPSKQ